MVMLVHRNDFTKIVRFNVDKAARHTPESNRWCAEMSTKLLGKSVCAPQIII
jgi:hypothetical protein